MTVTIKAKQLFAYIALSIFALVVVTFVRWSSQPSTVLKIKNNPVPAQPPEVKDGSQIFLTIDFCKSTSNWGVSEVYLLGEHGPKIPVNWPVDKTDKGCAVYQAVPIPIPANAPTDTYRVSFNTCYDVNPLKTGRCTEFQSTSFKVMNSTLNPGDAKVQ